ncbi:hypothetical protein EVAR_30040_1 [Eumeta japonica]|uniref:Uncharacterized protein n=1 Tax=Eumeta variegata TaxID=151549 RepID=A0A4C1VX37_EUMVA|nr:hypothetical protein EVAR_30040_1 [Eumeta japonica]
MDSNLYILKEYECGLSTEELSVECLLHAEDQVIRAPSKCELQDMVNEMNDSVKKRSWKIIRYKTFIARKCPGIRRRCVGAAVDQPAGRVAGRRQAR